MSDPLMNRFRNENLVKAGAQLLGAVPKDDPDTVRFLREVNDAIKGIKAHAQSVKSAAQLGGRDTTAPAFKNMLMEDLDQKLLDLFLNYSKDELVLILAQWWAIAILKETV